MGNYLTLHTEKQYSIQDEQKFVLNAYKYYKKQCKKPHGCFEIDINYLTGKSIEYKKQLALILLIKNTYTNSVVYDYSPKSLSEKINVSEYVIKNYINRLVSVDLCHYSGKHLQFVSLNKIMPLRSRGEVIQVSEKSTIKSIVENINILIIKNNFSSQDKLRKIKSDLIKSKINGAKINLKSYKKSLKFAELHPKIKDERLIDFNVIGMRKISQILGSSLDYAASFIKNLVRKKIISIKQIINKYADFEFRQFSSDELKKAINKKSGYFFCFNGSTYHHLGTEIKFK